MKFVLLFFAVLISFQTFSQDTSQFTKECRIAAGVAFANTFSGGRGGTSTWLQLDYRLAKNFSIALEFDNPVFKMANHTGPKVPDSRFSDFIFNALVKYHFDTKGKVKVAAGSGWSYIIRTEEYYLYEPTQQGSETSYHVDYSGDYVIPFLADVYYPLTKKLDVGLRAKYYLNTNFIQSYNIGIAASLKL